MPYLNKKILFTAIFFTQISHARLRDFDTTRLKSTAGTGAGSILAEESVVLNPASLAFFKNSTIYALNNKIESKDNSFTPARESSRRDWSYILSDGNGGFSGAVGFLNTEHRKVVALSLSNPYDEKSTYGITVKKTEDDVNGLVSKYYQSNIGIIHALDEQTTLGIVQLDAFGSKAHASKSIIGIQHALHSYVTVMADAGINYKKDLSDSLLYRGAIQIRILDDFYARVGMFVDKEHDEKGNGLGLAYVQPKLAFEFAIRNTKVQNNTQLNQTSADLKETCLSASLRF